MYRSDDEARIRRELNESKEKISSLNKEVLSSRKTIHDLHNQLAKLKKKSSYLSWIGEKIAGLWDDLKGLFPYLLMVVGFLFVCYPIYLTGSAISDHISRDRYVGTISSKEYHPPYTTYNTQCTTVGKVQSCRQVPVHHPENWTVDLSFDNEIRTYSIGRELFEEIERGHWLCLPDATLKDCNHGVDRAVYQ